MILAGAKPVAWYADGPAAGGPAITRHDLGAGRAWYLSARADADDHRRPARRRLRLGRHSPGRAGGPARAGRRAALLRHRAGRAGGPGQRAAAPGGWPHGLELVRRTDGQRRVVMLINHGASAATIRLAGRTVTVEAGDVQVLTE